MPAVFDLAHITDVHLPRLPRGTVRQLLSKRFFGFLSWHRRRHRMHRIEALAALQADLEQNPVDQIVVTGDLVNIALPKEFENAAEWLTLLGPAERVSVIPGNHDAYVDGAWRTGWGHWAPYMRGDDGVSDFPYVRRIGELALIGLSTSVPTPIGRAHGWLGKRQLDALGPILSRLGADSAYRIILIHHPPLGRLIKRRRGLADEEELRVVVAESGAEMVLCGHEHRFLFGQLAGPAGPVPVFAGPSASHVSTGAETFGGYLRFHIDTGGDRRLEVETRRFDPEAAIMVRHRRQRVVRDGDRIELQPLD